VSEREISAEIGAHDRFASTAISHPGALRKHNEDSYASCPAVGVWVVADGVGGHTAGDYAAQTATAALRGLPDGLSAGELLAEVRSRLDGAHRRLREEAAERGPDTVMATTVVVLVARGHYYACLWAGDSRAYLLRGGRMMQVTHDHSFVQELVDAGALDPEQAEHHPQSNIITRAVGSGEIALNLDKVTDRLRDGDRFLLCSDGLWKTMSTDDLAGLLGANGEVPAEELLAAALSRRADDNVTVITVAVGPEIPLPEGPPADEA
jgi:protein phosphatase/serine/threonine-protein phosphatase Stp1